MHDEDFQQGGLRLLETNGIVTCPDRGGCRQEQADASAHPMPLLRGKDCALENTFASEYRKSCREGQLCGRVVHQTRNLPCIACACAGQGAAETGGSKERVREEV